MNLNRQEERLVELMTAYQGGQLEGFEGLYQELRTPLRQYLVSRTLDSFKAEDLLQETFLQIHRSCRTYLPGKSVLAWAFGIARHVFLMDLRRDRRRPEGRIAETSDELPIPPDAERILDQHLVRRALSEISPAQREALLLNRVWGFSYKEIGGILGIRAGTAKLRAFRGMRELKAVAKRLSVTPTAQSAKESQE